MHDAESSLVIGNIIFDWFENSLPGLTTVLTTIVSTYTKNKSGLVAETPIHIGFVTIAVNIIAATSGAPNVL